MVPSPGESDITQHVSVLFPYRGDGGVRDVLFECVLARYRALHPSFEICIGEDDSEPFNRAAARNAAFAQATGDVLVINDADTWCSDWSLQEAIAYVAGAQERFVLPYDVYFNVNENWTRWFLQLGDPTMNFPVEMRKGQFDHRLTTAESGTLVVARDAWMRAGGYDERFTGYGWEDNAFITGLTKVCGQGLRIRGRAYHLHHDLPSDPFDHPMRDYNRDLYEKEYGGHQWRTAP